MPETPKLDTPDAEVKRLAEILNEADALYVPAVERYMVDGGPRPDLKPEFMARYILYALNARNTHIWAEPVSGVSYCVSCGKLTDAVDGWWTQLPESEQWRPAPVAVERDLLQAKKDLEAADRAFAALKQQHAAADVELVNVKAELRALRAKLASAEVPR